MFQVLVSFEELGTIFLTIVFLFKEAIFQALMVYNMATG